jgi:hypothetical protein
MKAIKQSGGSVAYEVFDGDKRYSVTQSGTILAERHGRYGVHYSAKVRAEHSPKLVQRIQQAIDALTA